VPKGVETIGPGEARIEYLTTRTSPLETCKKNMDKRQSKRKREAVVYAFVRMHPAQLAGASDAGMIFVLPGNDHQLLRSPFHSQRSYKIKKTLQRPTALSRQRHRTSGMPHPSQLQTDIRTGGDAITLMGYKIDSVLVFQMPAAFMPKIRPAIKQRFIGAISSHGSQREYVPCPSADSSWKPAHRSSSRGKGT
jgi:hypothetical protein